MKRQLSITIGYDVKSWKFNIQPFQATKFIKITRSFLPNVMCLKLHISVIKTLTCKP